MSTSPVTSISDLASFRSAVLAPNGNRERILVALADSIREKGLARVQITDVARHAGASRRTFYQCFPDKESSVVALAEVVFALSADHVAREVDPTAPKGTRIDQGIDAFLGFSAADPVLIKAIRTELPTIGPLGVKVHLESVDQFAHLVIELLGGPTVDEHHEQFALAVMLVNGLDGAFARAVTRGESIAALASPAKRLFRRTLGFV